MAASSSTQVVVVVVVVGAARRGLVRAGRRGGQGGGCVVGKGEGGVRVSPQSCAGWREGLFSIGLLHGRRWHAPLLHGAIRAQNTGQGAANGMEAGRIVEQEGKSQGQAPYRPN